MASGDDPDILGPVSQIHDSRIFDDPGMFGFKIAVLAFTSSLERSLNLFNVSWSAPSQTIAVRARLYTLEYCEIWSVICTIVDRDLVHMLFEGADRITCEYWKDF